MIPAGLPVALTLGEPAGIGPELTLDVWRRRGEFDVPPFYVIGDPDFYRARAAARGLYGPGKTLTAAQAGGTI